MKKKLLSIGLISILLISILTGCTESEESQYTENLMSNAYDAVGFPDVSNYFERQQLKEIYELSGEEFNINSPKQLGELLFDKLKLPVYKKTKSGYSTDVDVLERLKPEHPIIEKILEYRTLAKLNSTYIEGLKPYINSKTGRIHSYFHQTITATGRISSTEPNLQNIPTRMELGKKLRKVFKPEGDRLCQESEECLLPSPPASPSLSTAARSLQKAPRAS